MRKVADWWKLLCCCGLLTVVASCSLIDDDLSDCPPASSPEREFELDYELRLVTNMTTELSTQLSTETDLALAQALRNHLTSIFTDYAHDVDLSFYDTEGDSLRLQHDEHIMDATQASYSLNLPIRHYMHLAAANVVNNPLVDLSSDDRCHQSMVRQTAGDTLSSHTTGVYTARLPMDVREGVDQQFNVRLYMANCAAMLVIDPRSHRSDGIMAFSSGFASSFSICDSAYHFAQKPTIFRTTRLMPDGNSDEIGFCSVTFPSREPQGTRTVIETTDPFLARPDEASLWEFRVYVPQGDGSFTESILGIKEPLRAGQLKIIKCWLTDQGIAQTDDQTVAISVTLNWRPGQTHIVPL